MEGVSLGAARRWRACVEALEKSASRYKRRKLQSGWRRDLPEYALCTSAFQIDGNFGFAAAVLEMLVQYQDDRIFFLPALPEEWKDGKISGLRAPGGITIDFAWKDRCITECSLQSQTDMVRILLYNGIEKKIMLKADTICHIV